MISKNQQRGIAMLYYEEFCKTAGMTPPQEVYESAQNEGELENRRFLQEDYLLHIHKDYSLFPQYIEEIVSAAKQITADEFLLVYANLLRVAAFNTGSRRVGLMAPKAENPALCYAPLLALLAYIDKAEEEMRRRNIPQDIRLSVHSVYEKSITNYKKRNGFAAFDASSYSWYIHFLVPDIYPIGNLEFELTTMWCEDSVFRSANGTIATLREIEETEDSYKGKRILRGGTGFEEAVLSKAEYSRFLEPGDDVISVHIPRGTRLDAPTCAASYKRAQQFFKTYYPERPVKATVCRSWLMDPALAECLDSGAKILGFQNMYQRFPAESAGREVFTFVFNGYPEDLNTLPEDTSLFRALKKRYLQENPIYAYFGVLDPL